MTILPAKKKREKEPSQKSSTSGADGSSRPPSSQSASGSKRARAPEDGPPNKRSSGMMSPAGQLVPSPLSSPRSSSFPGGSEEKKQARSSPGGDCNSDDEYHPQDVRDEEVEAEFVRRLMARGLVIKEMVGDGACMFRAIAEQVYGDQEMHGQIRTLCMDYMMNNKDHFKEFITENYENYIQRKREENCHGNHVELQAISEMFARPVEVYQYSDVPINVLLPRPEPAVAPGEGASSSNAVAPQVQQNAPLRLSYHGAVHYNAILQPNVATIGVGLGLPGMVPGAADKDLMNRAMATSELEHIEEAMLQDKMDMTDYQRTQADIDDQIAQESLMSYLKDMEKSAPGAPEVKEEGPSTSAPSTSSAPPTVEESSAPIGLYEEMLAAQSLDWDDDMAIAGAMLLSQQDYLSNKPGPSNSDGPSSSGGSN